MVRFPRTETGIAHRLTLLLATARSVTTRRPSSALDPQSASSTMMMMTMTTTMHARLMAHSFTSPAADNLVKDLTLQCEIFRHLYLILLQTSCMCRVSPPQQSFTRLGAHVTHQTVGYTRSAKEPWLSARNPWPSACWCSDQITCTWQNHSASRDGSYLSRCESSLSRKTAGKVLAFHYSRQTM